MVVAVFKTKLNLVDLFSSLTVIFITGLRFSGFLVLTGQTVKVFVI